MTQPIPEEELNELCKCGHPLAAHFDYGLCFAIKSINEGYCNCEQFSPVEETEKTNEH